MTSLRRSIFSVFLILALLLLCQPLFSQTLITNVFTGTSPIAVAVNPATNIIYVVNQDDNTVAVIDGSTNEVTATITVGSYPVAVAANPATNRIYVANYGDDTVTLIDASHNNATHTIQVGSGPEQIAIDTVRNKIYVTNYDDNSVSVIDGATNLTSTATVRNGPERLAVNMVTNRIFVCNYDEDTVSVINGTNLQASTVLVGHNPNNIVLNPVTNKIYVTNYGDDTLSVIDGSTNHVVATLPLSSTPEVLAINPVTALVYAGNDDDTLTVVNGSNQVLGSIPLGDTPYAVAVNPVTDKIYLATGYSGLTTVDGNSNTVMGTMTLGNNVWALDMNLGTNRLYATNKDDGDVSVVAGVNASPMQWYSVAPCRVFDTRPPRGSGPIAGGTSQTILVPQLGSCNIPSTAAAYSLNVTVVPRGSLGYLTIWPTGEPQPLVSTMNAYDGRVKANAAIVPAGASGGVDVYVTNTTDVILDIDGYFAPASINSYEFYPLSPCRVLDTRNTPNGPLAGPRMEAGQIREFPILSSTCLQGVHNPQAYSFNVSVVPNPGGHPLGYLTIWPADQSQPLVSTLNNPTATVIANGAIVPASATNGDIKIYTYDSTDVFLDINGYFAAPGSGGLSMYPLAPCRAFDTRNGQGQPFQGTLSSPINVTGSVCAPAGNAKAYIFNATVVPYNGGPMGYLTLWPHGEQQMPLASTLNAYDGWVASNMAIVPNMDGYINAYADGMTHLIMDISGYFAPQQGQAGASPHVAKRGARTGHAHRKLPRNWQPKQ